LLLVHGDLKKTNPAFVEKVPVLAKAQRLTSFYVKQTCMLIFKPYFDAFFQVIQRGEVQSRVGVLQIGIKPFFIAFES
jgi:hypothetical protein